MVLDSNIYNAGIKICSRCLYADRVSAISFDAEGVCNYCHQLESLQQEYGIGGKVGEEKFERRFDEIRVEGKANPMRSRLLVNCNSGQVLITDYTVEILDDDIVAPRHSVTAFDGLTLGT